MGSQESQIITASNKDAYIDMHVNMYMSKSKHRLVKERFTRKCISHLLRRLQQTGRGSRVRYSRRSVVCQHITASTTSARR